MFDRVKGNLAAWWIRGAIDGDGLRRKIALRVAVKKMDGFFKEGEMEPKKFYLSKTFWTAVAGAVLGAIQPISASMGHPITVPAWVYQVLGAFGLYSIRDGIGKPLQ